MTAKEARSRSEKALRTDEFRYHQIMESIKHAADKGDMRLEVKKEIPGAVVTRLRNQGYQVDYVKILQRYDISW